MARILLVNLASLPMPGNEPIFPIGARCVEQALQIRGHQTRLLDFVEQPEALNDLETIAAEGWDVIGFAIRNIDPIEIVCGGHVDAYRAAVARCKLVANPHCTFVGGGPGFSLFAEELVRELSLDVGVRGAGEAPMLEIADDPGRFRGSRQVLDGSRYAGFVSEVLRHPAGLVAAYGRRDAGAMIGVETRRKTCFQRCVYCPYAYITGKNGGDLKPVGLLRTEIEGIVRTGVTRVFFTDGIFNSQITYAKDVVRMLSEQAWPNFSWGAYFTPVPFDDEFAGLLRASGVSTVVVSPDSLDPDLMVRLGKNFGLPAVDAFLDRCRSFDLRPAVNVVFGAPGETRQTVANSAKYINSKLRVEELVMHVGYRVLPHTALAMETGLEANQLLEPTYYPFDPSLFEWLMSELDSSILTPIRVMNLLAAKSSVRRMAKVETKIAPAQHARPVFALTRAGL
jgi:radical SAM superfamily enzyme YgiQ (UPF0313 family)